MRKLVLITGASSGVGLSLARHFSAQFEVVAVARRIERLQSEFEGNPRVRPLPLDVSDLPQVDGFCRKLLAEYGQVPYLINNAGVNIRGRVDALEPDDFETCLHVNALGPFRILRALIPAMRAANFGRVINITSGAPLNCFPEFTAYSASKAALNALSVTCARENADWNFRLNLMSPGPVRSEMAPNAPMDPNVCHPTAEYLLNLPPDGPTGRFFWLGHEIPLFPNLEGIEWLAGKADPKYKHPMPSNP